MTRYRNAMLAATALVPLVAISPVLAKSKASAPAISNADLLQRLDALQQRVEGLEQENKVLKEQSSDNAQKAQALDDKIDWRTQRLEKVENKVATAAKTEYAGAPRIVDPKGTYKFKVIGRIQAEYWNVVKDPDGRNYPSGGYLRRARIGAQGTLAKNWDYKFEADLARNNNTANLTTSTSVVTGSTITASKTATCSTGTLTGLNGAGKALCLVNTTANLVSNNNVSNNPMLTDVYFRYTGAKPWYFTVGKQYLPFGFEQQTSDNYYTFINTSVVSDIGSSGTQVGGGDGSRRLGVTALYSNNGLVAKFGLFTEDDSLNAVRADKNWTAVGRVAYSPIQEPTKWLHVGAATYYTKVLGAISYANSGAPNTTPTNTIQLRSRAVYGVDARVVDSGSITNVDNLWGVGGELAGVYGPFSLQGEYNHLKVSRLNPGAGVTASPFGNPSFDAFYVEGSWILTGESRSYDKLEGVVDRLKPAKDFGADGWGLVQLAARYEQVNYEKCGIANSLAAGTSTCNDNIAPVGATGTGGKLQNYTVGVNWLPTAYVKFMLDYVHSKITNGVDLYRVNGAAAGVNDYSLDSIGVRGQIDW